MVILLSRRRGKELEVSPVLDLALQAGADDQGWENGQNASVENSECDPAEGDQCNRRIDQCDDLVGPAGLEIGPDFGWQSFSQMGGAILPTGICEV